MKSPSEVRQSNEASRLFRCLWSDKFIGFRTSSSLCLNNFESFVNSQGLRGGRKWVPEPSSDKSGTLTH